MWPLRRSLADHATLSLLVMLAGCVSVVWAQDQPLSGTRPQTSGGRTPMSMLPPHVQQPQVVAPQIKPTAPLAPSARPIQPTTPLNLTAKPNVPATTTPSVVNPRPAGTPAPRRAA